MPFYSMPIMSAKKAAKKVVRKAAKRVPTVPDNSRAPKAAEKALALLAEARKAQAKASAAIEACCVLHTRDRATLMPAAAAGNPTREEIKPQVIDAIARQAELNNAPRANLLRLLAGDETLVLETHLNLTAPVRTRLSADYTRISLKYPNGKPVGPAASRNATTVERAINLVFAKANGK